MGRRAICNGVSPQTQHQLDLLRPRVDSHLAGVEVLLRYAVRVLGPTDWKLSPSAGVDAKTALEMNRGNMGRAPMEPARKDLEKFRHPLPNLRFDEAQADVDDALPTRSCRWLHLRCRVGSFRIGVSIGKVRQVESGWTPRVLEAEGRYGEITFQIAHAGSC